MPNPRMPDPRDYASADGTGFDAASYFAEILDVVGDGDIADFL